jgi:signal transduction histidine kinase
LRDLASGIHPTVLSDLGLRAAVDALVARSSVPVLVSGELAERRAPSVAATATLITTRWLSWYARLGR